MTNKAASFFLELKQEQEQTQIDERDQAVTQRRGREEGGTEIAIERGGEVE